MKRPLALLGAAAFGAAAAAALAGPGGATVLAAVCAALGLCALFTALWGRKAKKLSSLPGRRAFLLSGWAAAALLAAACTAGGYVLRWEMAVAPALALEGETVTLRGTVLEDPEEEYHRYYYRVQVEEVALPGEEALRGGFTVRLSAYKPLLVQPYDRLEATVKLSAYSREGGLFSPFNGALAEGNVLKGSITRYDQLRLLPDPGRSLPEGLVLFRRQVGRSFSRLLPEREAGLVRAMLLGERDRLAPEDEGAFRGVGASHLLVISGLHLTILAGFLMLLVRRLPLGQTLRDLLTLAGVWGYLLLIGLPASAVRAGIMFTLLLGSRALTRSPGGANSLGAAVLVLCLARPFLGGSVGFHLSVAGTLGLLELSQPLARRMLRPLKNHPLLLILFRGPLRLLAMTFSVQLATLPVQVFVFGGMSLLTPVAGLLLSLPCALLLYFSVAGAVLGLAPFLAGAQEALVWPAGLLARGVSGLAEGLSRFPGAYLDLTDWVTLWALGVCLLLLAVGVWRRHRPRLRRLTAGAMALVLAAAFLLPPLAARDTVTLAVLGQSSSVVALRGDRAVVLSLGGYDTAAAQQLLHRHHVSRVELLCLPLRTPEARQAAGNILARCPVEALALPAGAYQGKDLTALLEDRAVLDLEEGESLSLLDGGMTLTARAAMTRLELTIAGNTVVLETGTESLGGRAGLLITGCQDTAVISSLSLLQERAIMEEHWETLPAGDYIAPEGREILVDFFSDGTTRVRGKTDA